jgi:acetate kinase
MTNAILVINAGSSSIKFSLFGVRRRRLDLIARGQIQALNIDPRFTAENGAGHIIGEKHWGKQAPIGQDAALDHLLEWLQTTFAADYRIAAVGHRVVHGGVEFAAPVKLTPGIVAQLETLVPLAPLHQPHNLRPIQVLLERMPQLEQVACFDTAFHRASPPLAQMFALPAELTDEAGVRRYGFHGLSYEYIASVLPKFDRRAAKGRTVVLHLGNGASMCALAAGRSMATTMGFTAVDGLPMGTRSGSLDPGVMLYLMDQRAMDARAIEQLIYHRSGLLGVSGIASDMRQLLASDDPRAKLAIDLFVYRIGRELGSLAAALGGLDAIVFTGGIGENATAIRGRVCEDAAWLRVTLDPPANERAGPRISAPRSRVSAWVIPTDEERMIAQHTHRLIGNAH